MPELRKATASDKADLALELTGYAPEALGAMYRKEDLMAKGLGGMGKKGIAAKASAASLKKFLVPVEAATYATEALRLATNEDLREKRVEEVAESAKKGTAGRLFDSWSNPIGTIYGAGQTVFDTIQTSSGQAQRDEEYRVEGLRMMEETQRKKKLKLEAATRIDPFDRQYDSVPSELREPDDKEIGLGMVRSYLQNNALA